MADSRLKETIAQCQERTQRGAERLLKTFSFVPDDKVAWSPAKTARTPLAILAHCCMTNRMFAKVIRGEAMTPMPSHEEIGALSQQFEATIRDRAEAVRQMESSRDEVVAALASLTAERFATTPESPFGPRPMSLWVSMPGLHMGSHAAQIDYLQTIWGDMVGHM